MRKLLIIANVLLLSACAVGPDYQRPETAAPAAYLRAEQPLFSASQPDPEFWRRFDDELLARLVDDTLAANNDLRIALARYDRAQRERAHLQAAAVAAAEASRLARRRYELGVVDFLQVIDAERAQLEIEDRLAVSHTRTATQLVALYKALAGGWPERAGAEVAGRAEPLPAVAAAVRASGPAIL